MKVNNNFIVRTISGIILVSLLVGGILYSFITSFILLSLIAIAGVYELLSNLEKIEGVKPLKLYASAVAVLMSILLYLSVPINIVLSVIAAVVILRFIIETFRKLTSSLQGLSYEFFALIYVLFPMLLLTQIDGQLIIALFVLVWSNDVGAYIFGVSFGKHKLCERLSPKKSWEGYFGGIISAIIVSLIIANIFPQPFWIWIITAILISNAAVLGDLFESMIKRSLNIKDSGQLIPGHGGILDRFDALFFAAPIFYIICIFIIK